MPQQMNIHEIIDSVAIKNRVDIPVRITFDGRTVEWKPREVKTLPRTYAEWFQHKSLYKYNPGESDMGIPPSFHYKLVILGSGNPETDLTVQDVSNKELLDVENMPSTRMISADGKPATRTYIDPRSTGADSSTIDRLERQAQANTRTKIIEAAAETIHVAAAPLSEAEIERQVAQLRRELVKPDAASAEEQ